MSNDKPRPRSPAGFNAEEKKAWATFYARVGKDPLLAAELIALLDKDIELKRAHLALYLSSKEAMRAHQQRQGRNQHIAHAIRWLFRLLFAAPAKWLVGGFHRSTEIALASLPQEATGESAIRQVERIARNGTSTANKAKPEKAEPDKQQQQQPTG
jgi:hypothetical protein